MSKTLHISAAVQLPLKMMTLATAALANRGAGKTYFASVLAEELLSAGQQVIILDPVGVMWGLKSGYAIAIFGGDHADVPLAPTSGEVIARAVVEHRFSAIFDFSEMSNSGAIGFAADFLAELYRRSRQPCYVIIDEADMFAPQGATQGNGPKCLGAMQHLVRRGRARGLGCALITQRPQAIAKDVLTQCEVLVALRMNHPRDIGAVEEWVSTQASAKDADAVVKSLPSLPTGEAWFWAPSLNLFERARVRRRTTFDSSATPEPGRDMATPKHLEAVDIANLGAQITATVEEQKANDPAALKARIRELERQAAKPTVVVTDKSGETELREQLKAAHADNNSVRDLLRAADTKINQMRDALEKYALSADETIVKLCAAIRREDVWVPGQARAILERPAQPVLRPAPSTDSIRAASPNGPGAQANASGPGEKMAKAERAILTVLAQHGTSPKSAIAARANYSPGGGGFNNALSRLRVQGWIEGSEPITATPAGLTALGSYEPLPSGQALFDLTIAKLSKAERAIVQVLTAYPRGIDKETLADHAGYEPSGGGFNNAISALRTLQLVAPGQPIRLTPEFAEAVR